MANQPIKSGEWWNKFHFCIYYIKHTRNVSQVPYTRSSLFQNRIAMTKERTNTTSCTSTNRFIFIFEQFKFIIGATIYNERRKKTFSLELFYRITSFLILVSINLFTKWHCKKIYDRISVHSYLLSSTKFAKLFPNALYLLLGLLIQTNRSSNIMICWLFHLATISDWHKEFNCYEWNSKLWHAFTETNDLLIIN